MSEATPCVDGSKGEVSEAKCLVVGEKQAFEKPRPLLAVPDIEPRQAVHIYWHSSAGNGSVSEITAMGAGQDRRLQWVCHIDGAIANADQNFTAKIAKCTER